MVTFSIMEADGGPPAQSISIGPIASVISSACMISGVAEVVQIRDETPACAREDAAQSSNPTGRSLDIKYTSTASWDAGGRVNQLTAPQDSPCYNGVSGAPMVGTTAITHPNYRPDEIIAPI
jgi:hypothetical protein